MEPGFTAAFTGLALCSLAYYIEMQGMCPRSLGRKVRLCAIYVELRHILQEWLWRYDVRWACKLTGNNISDE